MSSDELETLWEALRPSIDDLESAAEVLVEQLINLGILDPVNLGASAIDDTDLQNALYTHAEFETGDDYE